MNVTLYTLGMTAAQVPLVWGASAVLGVAVTFISYVLVSMMLRATGEKNENWQFDQGRRNRIEKGNTTFRLFQPLVDELAGFKPMGSLVKFPTIQKHLESGADPLPWKAEEYVAAKAMEGVVMALLIGGILGWLLGSTIGVMAGLLSWLFIVTALEGDLKKRVRVRVAKIERDLPFAIDLMALTMEAGATFRDSLKTVVHEMRKRSVGQELGRIQTSLSRGQTLIESLEQLQERLPSESIKEVTFAIAKAEELGTPLSQIFMNLAEQMRLRRSQWAEKAAGKAETMINFPALMIMCSCLLIIIAPFVLSAAQNSIF